MTVALVRAAIVSTLQGVSGIGRVHSYQRTASSDADMKRLYQPANSANGPINGWFLRRTRTSEVGRLQIDSVEVIRWQIHGLYSLEDKSASELTFDALLESIRAAFRANDTLDGTVAMCAEPTSDGPAGIQIDDVGPATFCGVLVHAARLILPTTRYLHEV